jgi:alanyl-tRNA synthetase
MPLQQAQQIPGLRAVFGEVYPDPVRVVSMRPKVRTASTWSVFF